MKSYVLDNLVKYHCFQCDKEFIVSEHHRDKSEKEIICPYCHDGIIEAYVWMDNDLGNLEELAIGHFLE